MNTPMKTLLVPAILAAGLVAAAFSFASEKHDLDDEHILDIDVAADLACLRRLQGAAPIERPTFAAGQCA